MKKSKPAKITPSAEQKAILAVKKDTIVISNPWYWKDDHTCFQSTELARFSCKTRKYSMYNIYRKGKKRNAGQTFRNGKRKVF